MRISKDDAAHNREKVLNAAARLFKQRGFADVGVAELMREAGLTHGGFYNHFASKAELAAEACRVVLRATLGGLDKFRPGRPGEGAWPPGLPGYVGRYLSRQNRDAQSPSCAFVALSTDVTRADPPVQEAFAEGLTRYLAALQDVVPPRPSETPEAHRARTLALIAQMMGGLSMARAVAQADPALSDEILEACRSALGQSSEAAPA